MVDNRLLQLEARRIGLDKEPEVTGRIKGYLTNQAVLRLRQIEVLDKDDVEDAAVEQAFQERHGYKGRFDPAIEKGIKASLRRELEKAATRQRDKEFLDGLRAACEVWTDPGLSEALAPDAVPAEPDTVVVRAGGGEVTLGEAVAEFNREWDSKAGRFMSGHDSADMEQFAQGIREKTLDRLVTWLLVEQEAKSRGLLEDPDALAEAARQEDALLVNVLERTILVPLAQPTEEEARDYYAAHPEEFSAATEVLVAEMRFRDPEHAASVHAELAQGASFEHLAVEESDRYIPARERSWIPVQAFPEPVQEAIADLKPGSVSKIVVQGRESTIFKLLDRRGGETLPFEKVAEQARLAEAKGKYVRGRSEYLERLRSGARIKTHKRDLQKLVDDCWKTASGKSPAEKP